MELTAEDRLEIYELYSRWCVLLNTGDEEGWARLFTDDGVWEFAHLGVRAVGREALRAFAAEVHARERGLTRHYMHNVLLEGHGSEVHGRADIELLDLRTDGDARIVKTARYEDRIVATDGGWRFAQRSLFWDTPHPPADIGARQWDQQAT